MAVISLPPPRVREPSTVDSRGLAADLAARVRGEVRFDAGTRAAYSTDGSNYRQVPIGVVVPRDVDDAVAAVPGCPGDRGAGVSPRGGPNPARPALQCAGVLGLVEELAPGGVPRRGGRGPD